MNKWSEFNKNTKNNVLRELYVESVSLLSLKEIEALDIAAGAMNETRDMLGRGFNVTAIDSNEDLRTLAEEFDKKRLKTVVSTMEDYDYGVDRFDFIIAMFALPFIKPDRFTGTFSSIIKSLKQDGIFAFHLFGVNDEWANNTDMTFFNDESARNLLGDLDVIKFKEIKNNDKLASGETKRWHIFQIIIKKS